jgi:hypothetical protein
VPRGSPLARQLDSEPPPSLSAVDVVVEHGPTDEEGNLEPLTGGEVVLSYPSPEGLRREPDEVTRVISHAGQGAEPLVVVLEAAEELCDEELTTVLSAAEHTARPVILRVIRNG